MRIGLDAKRAFASNSGLGNYSRTLISNFAHLFTHDDFYLYSPSHGSTDWLPENNPKIHLRYPESFVAKKFPSFWRTFGIKSQLKRDKIQVYHGLSAEIPAGLWRFNMASVVTVHDLIFMSHPEFYKIHDRFIYQEKTRFACRNADIIVAASAKTGRDIMEYFGISQRRIRVVYQGVGPEFLKTHSPEQIEAVRMKYKIPKKFFLFVGGLHPRKNLRTVIEGFKLAGPENLPDLVFAGEMTAHGEDLKSMVEYFGFQNRIHFPGFIDPLDLPALYKGSLALLYPSVAEGFGIPLAEALYCGIPAICSNETVFREIMGEGALFCHAESSFDFSIAMRKLWDDPSISLALVEKGKENRRHYHPELAAKQIRAVYQDLVK